MPSRPPPHRRLAMLLRAALYALRGGFLVRPLLMALLLGAAGALLSELEEAYPALAAWVPRSLFPSRADPQVAQAILTAIATSIMTVVSIVFAILLMTLTLTSVQFSPRILVSFVRDRMTQRTLGMFLGTFSYCMAALPSARSLPTPFSPVATVMGAMLLALLCVGWLIFFINHIGQAISVNDIVDRIAGEAEEVIDELMPHPRVRGLRAPLPAAPAPGPVLAVVSPVSGYIRFIDVPRLLAVAVAARLQVRVARRVGLFLPAGVTLLTVSPANRLNAETHAALLSIFEIGPTRTLQQDVEYGVLQIVDIALKAISPAVNDPSTAITCLDQLSRILIRWTSRDSPDSQLFSPPHVLRVVVPWIDFDGILETAFEQIRHYAQGDIAVSLRLLRMLWDIGETSQDGYVRARLLECGQRVFDGSAGRIDAVATARLARRLAEMRTAIG